MTEQQFALLMEKLGEINGNLEMIDSRLYAVERCIWTPVKDSAISHLLVEVQTNPFMPKGK